MRKIVLLLFLLFCPIFFSPPYALAKDPAGQDSKKFFIKKITFSCDIPFSKEEFFYLTQLQQNSMITHKDLNHARKQLERKKRFTLIKIMVDDKNQNVHFSLTANWIFKEIVLHGILFGKNRYENLYLQHPGEPFDISLHEESLDLMKKLLYKKGYLSCRLIDEIVYNKKNKTITVKITIKKGPYFYVEQTDVHVKLAKRVKHFDATEEKKLQKKITEILTLIQNKRFSNRLIAKAKERIKIFLAKEGLSKNYISIKNRIDREKKRISLLFEITISAKPDIVFEGNTFFTNEQLKEILHYEEQVPDWLIDPNILAEQLVHAYYNHGFWQTRIKYKTIKSNKIIKQYYFHITEGKRISINSVVLHDTQTKKEEINKFFFQPIFDAQYYDQATVNRSIEELKNFYITHGFWDFSLTDQKFIHKNKNRYDLYLCVHKGKQRFLEKIEIQNFPELKQTQFFLEYTKMRGLPLNPAWLSDQRLHLLDRFQKRGYWYVDAQPEFEKTERTAQDGKPKTENISIYWKITPGEQVVFDTLFIRGNTRLPFSRIIKEMHFERGQLWDRKKLDHSRKRLKQLNIFKHIEMYPKKLSDQQSKKPIILTLLDDDPVEIKLRSGYFLTSKNFLLKRESTYKIGSTILVKNPLNVADSLKCSVDLTRFERDLLIDYQVPNLFMDSTIGTGKIYHHRYVHPLQVGKSDSAYQATQNGFLLGLTQEFTPLCFWGITLGNEWMRTSKVRGDLNLSPNMVNKTIPYFFIEPTLILDYVDDKIDTTKGSLTFGSFKLMIPETIRSPTYKIMIDQSLFYPIARHVICSLRVRWGHIFRRRFEEIMPIERFYLGGPYSVRGYSKDTVPPLGCSHIRQEDCSIKKEYTIQGGSSMINGNIELRFPIYKSFGGVIFQDIGTLSQSGFSGFKGKWYPASGCGLRYKTPIGPLRFDIGWKWKKFFATEPSYAWHLTLGEAF